jgi:hypothetical protein
MYLLMQMPKTDPLRPPLCIQHTTRKTHTNQPLIDQDHSTVRLAENQEKPIPSAHDIIETHHTAITGRRYQYPIREKGHGEVVVGT